MTWPPWARTTVAVDDGCRPPANTQAPAACTSLLKASTARYARFSSSGEGTSGPPSALYTASRYCFMVCSLRLGRDHTGSLRCSRIAGAGIDTRRPATAHDGHDGRTMTLIDQL